MKVFPFLFSTVAGLLFIGGLQQAHAQQGQRGEVQNQEFVIRKDRVLTLPKQNRPFAPVPVLPTPKSEAQFTYTVTPFYLATRPESIEVEPSVRNFPRKQKELYPGFVRAGFGNFISPLLEARYNLWEEQDFAVGGYLKHQGFYRGPVDGANSAEHLTEMGADARWFTDYFTFHGNLRYRRDEFRFYGFDPENEVLQLLNFTPDVNVLQEVGLSGKIQPIDQDAALQYVASFDVRNLTDGFRATESAASFTTNVHYRFENGFGIGFNSFLETTAPRM
ncbi:hypothetical protein A3SI_16245 [Nitritalea halalkaliphila LW7]|uniref:TonB-dependent receptor n=1 Tax=Nitritalea halalkaliphila LW7 TaxID=1189621 RepID=I5BXQ4_9BACT|nr:hypothetical protein [Nitritalea halalkaliphila]EIM74356.1 hypothetical protein A3SI_16245 [Nitritalea halalkaliphila LW7]